MVSTFYFKGINMFEPVYVCRASFDSLVHVIPAKTGIVKVVGCHYFCPAVKLFHEELGEIYVYAGQEGDSLYGSDISWLGDEAHRDRYEISLAECQKRYSSIPKPGEAWLVTEGRKYINWDRADQNMFLLNEDGSFYKEDHNG